ncbi:uncharacterized protein LOC128162293 [Crassostrea angulata]|uniref:uncharacterized protein LOC128162293 n=1 Tax=Magallana angulata TaxID=2784310 RepID=UPI0022B0B32B|nr:uncharacterized protein LOC128162293 [Crassostrea angulata]
MPLTDFKDGRGETKVTLSKTRSQQDGPLRKESFLGEKFSTHSSTIKANSTITSTCVRVRLPLNGELYGYDVEIPDGHQIDVNKTVITPKSDVIEIKIVKIGEFTLPA